MLMCYFVLRGICLSTFSHDAVRILASPESTARGRALCKTGELILFPIKYDIKHLIVKQKNISLEKSSKMQLQLSYIQLMIHFFKGVIIQITLTNLAMIFW